MGTIKQSDFDKLVAHTILIELMNGHTLVYHVSLESKTALYSFLKMEAFSAHESEFVWFYIPEDRLVFINKKEIVRITFCFDPGINAGPQYRDNFGLMETSEATADPEDIHEEESDEDACLPQLIVMHERQLEDREFLKGITMKSEGYFGNISSYSSLDEGDVEGLYFEYDDVEEQWLLITLKYLQFIDDDGEENFMPFHNLEVIEIERHLLMTEAILDRYLQRKTKKQNRPKKK